MKIIVIRIIILNLVFSNYINSVVNKIRSFILYILYNYPDFKLLTNSYYLNKNYY